MKWLIICVWNTYVLIVFLWFSGPGDGFFSSAFQSTLQGNVLYKNVVPAGIWIA